MRSYEWNHERKKMKLDNKFDEIKAGDMYNISGGTILSTIENFLVGRLIYTNVNKVYKMNKDGMIIRKGKYTYIA